MRRPLKNVRQLHHVGKTLIKENRMNDHEMHFYLDSYYLCFLKLFHLKLKDIIIIEYLYSKFIINKIDK
jgi:hypothetical protein